MAVTFDYDAVLFDVDGTLINSNGAHASAWTQALQRHDFDVRLEDVRRRIGMGGDKLLPAVSGIAEDSDVGKAVSSDKRELFRSLLPGLAPTPGARALVEHLAGARGRCHSLAVWHRERDPVTHHIVGAYATGKRFNGGPPPWARPFEGDFTRRKSH